MAKKNTIRVFEGFAGYGGASFGLKKANIPHKVIGYSDIEQEAIELYEYNFPNIRNYGDITQIDEKKLPDFDLFTGGFPCQPFSTVGKMLGELDTRGTLFNDIIRICEYKQPRFILLENVKGLLGKKHRPTLDKIISELNVQLLIEYRELMTQIVANAGEDSGDFKEKVQLLIDGEYKEDEIFIAFAKAIGVLQ